MHTLAKTRFYRVFFFCSIEPQGSMQNVLTLYKKYRYVYNNVSLIVLFDKAE